MDITRSDWWGSLANQAREFDQIELSALFDHDPGRAKRMTSKVGDLIVDWSKHRLTDNVIDDLIGLAGHVGLTDKIRAMTTGQPINTTEHRPALHTALRAPADSATLGEAPIIVDGVDVVAEVRRVLDQMGAFSDRVRDGDWTGHTGNRINTVVNIGIGGSDLGPVMAYEALTAYHHPRVRCRFVSNVDASDLISALTDLDPASTLFIVSSKTFTTNETLTNARSARRWLIDQLGPDAVAKHFVAVSTNSEAVAEFGIDTANMFAFWDWVGGRYSIDSAIGLSLMVSIGRHEFNNMLAGFRIVDEHFKSAPIRHNIPAMLGLIALWYRSFCALPTRAVLPYSRYLHRFPAYLQQLDMESNGKRVTSDGDEVAYQTAPIVWGAPGTNGQHSFHQLLHQGTTIVPADFIVFANPDHPSSEFAGIEHHHSLLVANCLAQSAALAFGRSAQEVAASEPDPSLVSHRTFPGNRPSTTIMAPSLTPSVLGQLVALYEHQVFTQGAVWGINSFDQWGVELGKELAVTITSSLSEATPAADHDPSTNALINHYRALQ